MATLEPSLEANYDRHRTDIGQADKATYRGTSYRSAQKVVSTILLSQCCHCLFLVSLWLCFSHNICLCLLQVMSCPFSLEIVTYHTPTQEPGNTWGWCRG